MPRSHAINGGLSALRALRAPFLALLDEIGRGSGTMKITMKTTKITLKNSPVALLLHEAEREISFVFIWVQQEEVLRCLVEPSPRVLRVGRHRPDRAVILEFLAHIELNVPRTKLNKTHTAHPKPLVSCTACVKPPLCASTTGSSTALPSSLSRGSPVCPSATHGSASSPSIHSGQLAGLRLPIHSSLTIRQRPASSTPISRGCARVRAPP